MEKVDSAKLIEQSIDVKRLVYQDRHLIVQIDEMAETMISALKKSGAILVAGNGGSFSDSLHIVAELTGRFERERKGYKAHALGANISHLSAVANDYGYEDIFSRELCAISGENDVLLAISCSGNSPNIIKLVKTALKRKLKVFGLTGKKGGELKDLCSCIQIPSYITARIQECHIMIGHILCSHIDQADLP